MKPDTTPASDLERRKKVRLRVRVDLSIAPQKYEGRTYYVVKDPVSLRYYRFKEQEYFLIQLMDGKHTLDDAQKEFEKRFRPDRLTLEDLEGFGQQLLSAGLAQNESPQAGKQLYDRRKKRRRSEIMQALTNILYIKIPIYDPEKLLGHMLRYTKWMFTTWFLLLSVGVMLAAVMLVLTHFQTFMDRLPSYHEFFSFKTVMYLWLALGLVKVIHEFGHGLSCKAFGGEVHEMGALFLCFSPCLYCNVSDAWTLPSKWKRIIISGAGIYVELIIASIATFVWWNTPTQPFINNLSLSLMIVCSVSTVFFNANPLMRYDGYYVLADWLEIPNLRDRSNRYLQRLVMEYCLGIETQPEPYMELWRRILFLTYAVVSYIYRWVVTFVILWFMYNFLKPYKLGVISAMLAIMAAGSMVGWPLYRLGKNLHKRGRVPDMKPVRVTISASVLAAVLLLFFFLPLPVSRVRETGLVQVRPAYVEPVHVKVPGVLEKIRVKEGQLIRKGAVLAEFSSLQMKEEEQKLYNTYQNLEQKVRSFTAQNAPELEQKRSDAMADRDSAKKQWLSYRESRMPLLVLRSPRAGIVMGLPKKEEIGKRWEPETERPFCSIGNPHKLRVLVPVSQSDYELIRLDLARLKKEGKNLEVTLRVHGRDSHTWKGKVTLLPLADAKDIPIQLSKQGGGTLGVKQKAPPNPYGPQSPGQGGGTGPGGRPSQGPSRVTPQNAVHLIGITILNPDRAISPGSLAQVKIHCRFRTCAWWVWRWISGTLELKLM
jgi:putative peptide zinc metalloprotease protein